MQVTTKARGVKLGAEVWLHGVVHVVVQSNRTEAGRVLGLVPVWRVDHCRS
jgi:hypothetical protein